MSFFGSIESFDSRVAMAVALAVAVGATLWLSSRVQSNLRRRAKRGEIDMGSAGRVGALFNYGLVVVGVLVALQITGIDLSTLFAAGAILAVGLGFALQEVVQNFVSGLILLGERQIRAGDILEIDNLIVKVIRLGIRTALVESRDGVEIIVPNGMLAQTSIRNFTLNEPEYRIRTTVGVSYDSDPEAVRRTLEEVGDRCPARLPQMRARVLLTEFANSSVTYEVAVWVADPWEARLLLSQLNEDIWVTFRTRGITIAFPQLDVHLPGERLPSGSSSFPKSA